MTSAAKPMPFRQDVDTGGFWQAAQEDRLVVRHCHDCERDIHPPRAHCRNCGGWNTGWRELSGRGFLYSWTVVEQQLHPAFEVPYTLVLVEAEDAPGVRFLGTLPDGDAELEAGMGMMVCFERLDENTCIPQWSLAPD